MEVSHIPATCFSFTSPLSEGQFGKGFGLVHIMTCKGRMTLVPIVRYGAP